MPDRVDRVARILSERTFPELARAIRDRSPSILRHWREESIAAMPDLSRLTAAELESSAGLLLDALADAAEGRESDPVRRLLREGTVPFTSILARPVQRFSAPILLAEDLLFRFVLVSELRQQLGRPLAPAEIVALHALLDLLGEQRLFTLIGPGHQALEQAFQRHLMGKQRLEQMGTLVAGVAHDAINLFLRLHMLLEHIENTELSPTARQDLESVRLVVLQFQNSVVNLRWLSTESPRTMGSAESLDLNAWAVDVQTFHRSILPPNITLVFDLPPGLSRVRVSAAALSQAVFNLIRNAQQAITAGHEKIRINANGGLGSGKKDKGGDGDEGGGGGGGGGGRITVAARPLSDGTVTLTVEDDGPGMSPHVLERCTESFFTTYAGNSGLGLALVRELITGSGGEVRFLSPPTGKSHGTLVLLKLPASPASK